MEIHSLYPDDDKAKLIINKTDNWDIHFIFDILEKYRNRLWITFWVTIWYGNSWETRIPIETKKLLSNIADKIQNETISKDNNWKLKIIRSSWSSDITISYRLNNPKKLNNTYDIILNKNSVNENILHELLSLFNN